MADKRPLPPSTNPQAARAEDRPADAIDERKPKGTTLDPGAPTIASQAPTSALTSVVPTHEAAPALSSASMALPLVHLRREDGSTLDVTPKRWADAGQVLRQEGYERVDE